MRSRVRLDLDEVVFELEDTGLRKEDMTAQCPQCQETISQVQDACAGCKIPVVWHHSPTWKRRYGDPVKYEAMLDGEDLKPRTPLQAEVCVVFGRAGKFQTITQQKEFLSLERRFPDDYIRELLVWGRGKHWRAFVSAVKNTDNYKKWSSGAMKQLESPGSVDDALYAGLE